MKILKCLLMIVTAPVVLALTLFVWLCTGLIYISSLVLGLLSTVIALLGVAVIITYSPQNGVILLVIAFLISPMGLPLAAIWLLGKVQDLKYTIQDRVYVEKWRGIWIICQIKKNCCCWTEHFAYMENYTLHHKFKKLCYPINWRWNNAENFNC